MYTIGDYSLYRAKLHLGLNFIMQKGKKEMIDIRSNGVGSTMLWFLLTFRIEFRGATSPSTRALLYHLNPVEVFLCLGFAITGLAKV